MFGFEPDELQKECFMHIDNNMNLLVSMPTGCGKTAIGIYAIAKHMRENKKVIYTTPIKSLSNEKYKDFRELYGNDNVGIMTGDNQINPDGMIVIMTTEILRNDLYKKKLDLGCVIFDEVHYINDEDRGTIWEESLILLDPSIQLVLLSATINKPYEFANWITTIKKRQTKLVINDIRPVPLIHYIWNGELNKIMENDILIQNNIIKQKDDKRSLVGKVLQLLDYLEKKDLLQAIYFSFSRKMCEKLADSVNKCYVTNEESICIQNIFDKYMSPFKKNYESLNQYYKIHDLILKGVAYHHSGLAPLLKEIVEILFKKKLLKVLFVTETFAVGINMPTRTVVFTELTKFTKQKKRNINVTEYKQMAGRAGRRGIDKIGNVIIMDNNIENDELKKILTGSVPNIISKLNINYQLLLKLLLSDTLNLEYIIESSMFGRDLINNINEYKLARDNIYIETNETNEIDDINYKKLYEMEKLNENIFFSKKQSKLLNELKKKCQKEVYDKYKNKIESIKLYEYYNNKILIEEQKIESLKKNLYNILELNGFIKNNIITEKGIISTNMNECNALLLTDMLYNNIFDDMTSQEIAGLMAIFIEDTKDDNNEEGIISKIIIKKINIINIYISNYKLMETENNIYNDTYWDISTKYVNSVYNWANGMNISKDIYEGNFIKGILKIINIIKNLIVMCEIKEDFNLTNKLMNIESLLIRDYVTTSSLYII